jgi:hypothetical protein
LNLAEFEDEAEVVPAEDDDDDPVEEAPAVEVVVLREAEELAELFSFGLTEAIVGAEAAAETEAAGVFMFSEGNTGRAAEEGGPVGAGVAGVDPTGVDDVEANLVPDADPDHFSYFASKALRRSSKDILAGSISTAGLTIEAAGADEAVEPVSSVSGFVLVADVVNDDVVAAGSSSRSESEMSSISFIIRELLWFITVEQLFETDLGLTLFGNFLVPNLGS